MSLSAKLVQRQSQSLAITPQLAQSIKLLQLSHMELFDFVADEIEKNPLLELASDRPVREVRGELAIDRDSSKTTDSGNHNEAAELSLGAAPQNNDTPQLDISAMENAFDTGTAGAEKQDPKEALSRQNEPSSRIASEDMDYLSNVGEAPNLINFLERQIALELKGDEERKIANYIIHELDNDGYFREDLAAVAQQNNTSIDMVSWVLERIHNMEPVGIGARNLAECLEIQLKDKNRFDPAMKTLLENIDLLAKREFAKLLKICAVSKDDFNDMLREIQALDPRPASSFEPTLAETVIPDVTIKQGQMGEWSIELNPETLPKVLIDNEYQVELSATLDDEKGKQFITDCMENANWLTKSLDQRANTILKVASEIVKKQDQFFVDGAEYLKPLTLKQVADAIKMHESTVSRVTSNKYLMCDHGTYELKYFFSSAIGSSDGETKFSAESVKFHIRKLVDDEDPKHILSDEQIVSQLQEAGIEIARRTVAKYREAMNIASSVERRRQKTSF